MNSTPRREQRPVDNIKHWYHEVIGKKKNGKKRYGPWMPFWLDAKPGDNEIQSLPDMPEHPILVEYAKVSRLLDRVTEIDPRARSGLETYYGDQGAIWGRTSHGRMFALYQLTKAGRQILSRSASNNPNELGMAARLAVEADLDRQQPKVWRRQLLNAADEQARRIYDRVCLVWNQAKSGGTEADWRDHGRQLLEAVGRRGTNTVGKQDHSADTFDAVNGDPGKAA